jgi:hypothetical protein
MTSQSKGVGSQGVCNDDTETLLCCVTMRAAKSFTLFMDDPLKETNSDVQYSLFLSISVCCIL